MVLDLAAQELLKAFLTARADGAVVAVEDDSGVARLQAVLLQPVSNTGADLPVITGGVQNGVLFGRFDDTVEGDEGDTCGLQRFLTGLRGIVQRHHNNNSGVAVGDDGVALVDLLFTGRGREVCALVGAGLGDLFTLGLCIGTGLCSPAMVRGRAHDVDGLAVILLGVGLAATGDQSENHNDSKKQCDDFLHFCSS